MLPPHVAAMLSPAFYPHATRDIRLVQTHASYVVLTGDFVYKLKKPVDFGFLDYTTPAKRKHFCEEELRLNRRFAPELYLEVLGIQRQEDAYALGPLEAAGAVDYAVRMRQFADDALLSTRIAQGRVQAGDLDALIRDLVQVHRDAPPHPEVDGLSRVRKVVTDNFHTLRLSDGTLFSAGHLEALEADAMRRLDRCGPLLAERAAAGRFRECHGDLHTGNVAYVDGRLRPFDAIEFSDTYRIIDVLAEAAFLLMDLEALGETAAANRCMNLYLEESGDWAGAPLLPLYLSYRALVRAKVAALTSADAALSPGDKHAEEAKARRYFETAQRIVNRYGEAQPPAITIMFGLSGSGKSTVARRLAAEQGGVQIRSDAVRKHLAGVPLRGRPPAQDIYTQEFTEQTFSRMLQLATACLEAGMPVVLDGRYARRSERDAVRAVARELGTPFRIFACEAGEAELERRLRERQEDASDATFELLERQKQNTEPLAGDELAALVK